MEPQWPTGGHLLLDPSMIGLLPFPVSPLDSLLGLLEIFPNTGLALEFSSQDVPLGPQPQARLPMDG